MASLAGAIRTYLLADSILTAALGGQYVYRDDGPESSPGKYVVITEGVSTITVHNEVVAEELVQVDVWQRSRADDGSVVEDPGLGDRIKRRLDRAVIQGAPTGQVSIECGQMVRLLDRQPGSPEWVHQALTIRVIRQP